MPEWSCVASRLMAVTATAATGSPIMAAMRGRDIVIGNSLSHRREQLGFGVRTCGPAVRLHAGADKEKAFWIMLIGHSGCPGGRTLDRRQAGTPAPGGWLSPEEFSDFYAGSFRRLVGQLAVMTGNRAEAQDAVQEAFVRAWAHRDTLDQAGSPDAWVRTAAWRIAVSRWRRARLGSLLHRRSQPRPPVADGPSPDRVALVEALRKVPPEQRRAVVLYYLCDLSVAEIARETAAPEGTVKARLARGRAALAPHLDELAQQAAPGGPGGDGR